MPDRGRRLNPPVPRVLLADDSPDARILVRAYLRGAPFELFEAENGVQAVERATAGGFAAVLMDMQMPEMDGFEATRAIREWERADPARGHVPIVALTAYTAPEEAEKARAAGCDEHVAKPLKKPALRALLERLTRSAA